MKPNILGFTDIVLGTAHTHSSEMNDARYVSHDMKFASASYQSGIIKRAEHAIRQRRANDPLA